MIEFRTSYNWQSKVVEKIDSLIEPDAYFFRRIVFEQLRKFTLIENLPKLEFGMIGYN